jgi:hypothetical protein
VGSHVQLLAGRPAGSPAMRVRVSASAIQVCGETRNIPATFRLLARNIAPAAGCGILPELKQTLIFRFLSALGDNLTLVMGYLTTFSVSRPEVQRVYSPQC